MRTFNIILVCFFFLNGIQAQLSETVNPDILEKEWPAHWITSPGISGKEYGVYLFRKDFSLDSLPGSFLVHVSADNRYKLFLNGTQVSSGPARGDLQKWFYESVDLAPLLKKGDNVLSAVVWNFASFRPSAQVSDLTGFILQGNTDVESIVNTDSSWSVFDDKAYTPLSSPLDITGAGEHFDANLHPWSWMDADYDYQAWKRATELENGHPLKSLGLWGGTSRYILFPRDIPPMEEKTQYYSKICRSDLPGLSDSFLKGGKPITIPANSHVTILVDQAKLTNAYPVINFSKGKGSTIQITYSECMYGSDNEKGNRNVTENKTIHGDLDLVIADGGENREFKSLWFRTFRYIELDIETKAEALEFQSFYSIFTGYPFAEKASFSSDDPLLAKIWETGWLTQRLCAQETYVDCPFYEQLQYVGDTRIQALISGYVSGDYRLAKKALVSIHESRLPCGLTQSRYPGYEPQVIPPFSLVWNTMVYDYWMLNDDPAFIRSMIPGMMDIINWYESRLDKSMMFGPMEYWNFVDWVDYPGWAFGAAPGQFSNEKSAVISLQFVYTLQKSAEVLEAYGMKDEADRYLSLAENIKKAVYNACWDDERGLIADTPARKIFSQHCNSLAILTSTVPEENLQEVALKTIEGKNMAVCSLYFRFYMTEAVDKAGLADLYPDMLEPWIKMLDAGLSTFAEVPDPTRSDCHAWSASPVYFFLSEICGIKPSKPGFAAVRIAPHPGRLQNIEGSMPHPQGTISVSLNKDKHSNLSGEVLLPESLSGEFYWGGTTIPLKGGVNKIKAKSN